jgi:hypothetical protein
MRSKSQIKNAVMSMDETKCVNILWIDTVIIGDMHLRRSSSQQCAVIENCAGGWRHRKLQTGSALPFCVCGSCRNMVPVGRSLFHLKVSCILQIGVAMGLTLVCFVAVHLQSSGRSTTALQACFTACTRTSPSKRTTTSITASCGIFSAHLRSRWTSASTTKFNPSCRVPLRPPFR